ncbi:Poly(R)-hydroxyalkanoic acid synthase subunit (PHA_synth_III_E) [Flexibacter flexilis DSM 6793]|uniref:Poly(3-hydroxyalkanoate) polymerase subunit PhaE n=1 Tax=Flexibacter flexilis DSM 6793 TaxID=927664 RepID=A0A1I1NN28_9BACT|nr:poly(R)-hydroxyalkanoic acid synthase subunit PhaE [Flexibacter flexilis]SFC98937.1 Poly(R)-hydroxyalkanoic acid synthase subunit (PHA_synth_III_E) [Flexibacter flexilis DSM 6793]
METAKNVLDAWVETQNKAVSNMVETTKKFQESIAKGNVLEKGTDIYKDWFENQKTLMESAFSSAPVSVSPQVTQLTKNATDTYNELLNMQLSFAKTWADTFNKAASSATTPPFSQDAFLKEASRLYEKWNSLYQSWLGQATPQWSALKPADWSKAGNFDQLINASGVYFKLYETWQPLAQQWQKFSASATQVDADWWKKAYNPEAYKEVFDKMFGFANSERMKDYFNELSHFVSSYQDTFKHWQNTFNSQVQSFNKSMAHPSAYNFGESLQPFVNQIDKALEPLGRLLPEGKEKESYEAMLKVKEDFAQFWKKYTEFQYMVYNSGQKAMEMLMAEQTKKMSEGVPTIQSYNEFYSQWLNTTEKVMIETFGTEEFSTTQGEMLRLGLGIKHSLEKQIEKALSSYPVVSRTEADEMAQTIHELRNRVRQLERALDTTPAAAVLVTDEEKAVKKNGTKPKA